MATEIVKYLTHDGKKFDDQLSADVHEQIIANDCEIQKFVEQNFPNKSEGLKGNPHAGTAMRAIAMWVLSKQ